MKEADQVDKSQLNNPRFDTPPTLDVQIPDLKSSNSPDLSKGNRTKRVNQSMDMPWQNADSFVKIYGQIAHKKNRLSIDPAVRISTVTFSNN